VKWKYTLYQQISYQFCQKRIIQMVFFGISKAFDRVVQCVF